MATMKAAAATLAAILAAVAATDSSSLVSNMAANIITTTTTTTTKAPPARAIFPAGAPKIVLEYDVTEPAESERPEDDNPQFTMETFTTIMVTILIVITNCIILVVTAWTEAFSNFNKTFIYSLTLADLFIGLFITPYSIFLSVYRRWVFSSETFCSVEAYMLTTFISAKMYSLTWLNVDHYVAVRKPERYGVMMSSTRSCCWIGFSWMVAVSFCCPPLFSFRSAIFNKATYICMVDTKVQIAYLLTSGVLVSFPAMLALAITGGYLFTRSFKKRISFYEKVFFDLSSRPRNYRITFIMSVIFFLFWTPFLVVNITKVAGKDVPRLLQFYSCWLGLSESFSKFLVLAFMSRDFRQAVLELCTLPSWWPRCRANPDPNIPVAEVNVIRLPS